jgi:hypothetical protein
MHVKSSSETSHPCLSRSYIPLSIYESTTTNLARAPMPSIGRLCLSLTRSLTGIYIGDADVDLGNSSLDLFLSSPSHHRPDLTVSPLSPGDMPKAHKQEMNLRIR